MYVAIDNQGIFCRRKLSVHTAFVEVALKKSRRGPGGTMILEIYNLYIDLKVPITPFSFLIHYVNALGILNFCFHYDPKF